MATFIKGDPIENATYYELYDKRSDGTYTLRDTKAEINFEVSGFSKGEYTFVVKAKARGYEDSDYSNEVVYTVEDSGVTISNSITPFTTGITYSEDMTVGGSGSLTSSTTYDSYTITLPYDGIIYPDDIFVNASTSIYIAIYHDGTSTRYRKSDNNLPTSSSPLSVKAGEKLIISITKAFSHVMRIIYSYDNSDKQVSLTTISGNAMTLLEGYNASTSGMATGDTTYNSYLYTPTSNGYLYMTDFDSISYVALAIMMPNDDAAHYVRYRKSSNNIPTNATPIPVGASYRIYVTIPKTANPTFNLQMLTEV